MREWQHPFMAAVHPWLMYIGIGLFAVSVVIALWRVFTEDDISRSPFVLLAVGIICWLGSQAADPLLEGDERWKAVTLFFFGMFGIFALCEWWGDWEIKPFRLLVWAPVAVDLGRMAMTIPAHLRSGVEQLVVVLNQVPDPVKNALMIGAALLTFAGACVKFIKSLVG
jgi:hypothetical protein